MLVLLPVVLLAGAGNPPCPHGHRRHATSSPTGRRRPACSPRRCSCAPGAGIASAPPSTAARWPPAAPSSRAPDSFAELSLLDTTPTPASPSPTPTRWTTCPTAPASASPTDRASRSWSSETSATAKAPARPSPTGSTSTGPPPPRSRSPRTPSISHSLPPPAPAPPSGNSPTPTDRHRRGRVPDAAERTAAAHPRPDRRILSDGLAAAPQDAPAAVKRAIAAGNQIHDTPYSLIPGDPVHYGPLAACGPPMTAPARSPTCSTRSARSPSPKTPAS